MIKKSSKMHSKMCVLLAMSAFLFGHLVITNNAVELLSFQVIQPTGHIYVADQVQLQCVISGFNTFTDSVLIFIRYDNGDIRTLATEDGRYFQAPQNVQSPGIQQDSILSVTINDIDLTFGGRYTCYIARIAVGTVLDQQDLRLDVLLFHPPICLTEPMNDDLIFNDTDEIRITCVSEIANPADSLLWNLQSETAITLPQPNITSSSNIKTSNIDLIITTNYNGTTFTCLREIDLGTCTIGPLLVRSLLPTTATLLTTVMTVTESLNDTAMSIELQSGIIVAIVLSVIVIIAIVFVAIIVSIRSRHVCVKSNPASADNSHDNPHLSIDIHDGHSPANGENYTSLQKNTLEDKSAKLYQDLLPVPRSPNNHETDGDQCTNVGMVSLEAEEPDYVVKSVSHKTMNASQNDSKDYEDVKELREETYEEIPEKCYEEIPESRAGISPIPAAAQEPKSVVQHVQHVYLDFTGEIDTNEGAPEAAASTPDQHDQLPPVHVNSSNEVVYANQTRVQDFK